MEGPPCLCLQEWGIEHRRTNLGMPGPMVSSRGFPGPILREFWRCAFPRAYYRSLAPMQRDLNRYLRFYNLNGRTKDIDFGEGPQHDSKRSRFLTFH